MDVNQGRRCGVAGKEQVERFTRPFALGEAKMPVMPLTKARAARSPVGKESWGRWYRDEVVVGFVEPGAIHSAVQHGLSLLSAFGLRLWLSSLRRFNAVAKLLRDPTEEIGQHYWTAPLD